MAGNAGDGCRSLDGSLPKEIKEELGLLAVSVEQCALDYLGRARWSLCTYHFASLSCILEYQGSCEE